MHPIDLSCRQKFEKNSPTGSENISALIIYMKKLLDSDWLKAMQFKCNTSAKSVTPMQKV